MALRNAFLLSLVAFSLTLPFLAFHCGSLSDYLLSSGPGLGEGRASSRVFLIAPRKKDCVGNIPCNTVSFYSQKYTTGVSDAIFYFLPGNHTLSQDWNMSHFSNVTLRGRAYSGEHHSIRREEIEIHGSVRVNHSVLVVFEKITFKHTNSGLRSCLGFNSTVSIAVRNVAISHCSKALKREIVRI